MTQKDETQKNVTDMLEKAEITDCPNKIITGREMRRLRVAADISEEYLAAQMGTSRSQIRRMENKLWLEFQPKVMEQLLNILGATLNEG